MKKETNKAIVVRVMRANEGKSMAEVVTILMDLLPSPPAVLQGKQTQQKFVEGCYRWGIRLGAPGEAS